MNNMQKKIFIKFRDGDPKKSKCSTLWITINDYDVHGKPIIADILIPIKFGDNLELAARILMTNLGKELKGLNTGIVYEYERKLQ